MSTRCEDMFRMSSDSHYDFCSRLVQKYKENNPNPPSDHWRDQYYMLNDDTECPIYHMTKDRRTDCPFK